MSEPTGAEFSGKSVEEATSDGLRALGLRAEEATVEVLNRGSRGLFGIGSEPAVVRIVANLAAQGDLKPTMPPKIPSEDLNAKPNDVPIEPIETGDDQNLDNNRNDSAPLAATVLEEVVTSTAAASAAASAASGASEEEVEDEVADMGIEMLGEMVRLMGFDCTVTAAWKDADEITDERHLLLDVHGAEASGLIGRRGETLENIQYLLRLMVNQRMHRWMNIIVDIEDFRARRVEHLTHLAQRMAQQAVDTGRSQALEPMTPNERRIVHLVLRDDERVFTESTGEGERRKVVIFAQH